MYVRVLLVLSFALILGGCAMGQKTNYSEGHIAFNSFNFNSDGGCKITVVDNRPYVLSGKKSPTFTGILRGGYGNPFDMNTESGKPLADDLTLLFARSYQEVMGVNCVTGEEMETRKTVVYTLNEWKTDIMRRGRFIYDVDTSVSVSGDVISNEKTTGTIVIDKNFPLPNAITQATNQIHSNARTAEALGK